MAGSSLPPAPPQPPEWQSYVEAAREVERELNEARTRCETLERERDALRADLKRLKREVAHLREVYPLLDLLEAKEVEVKQYEGLLEQVPATHPDRAMMEFALRAHQTSRDELRRIAEQGRKRLELFD